MSRVSLTAAERKHMEREKSITNAETLAWAKRTLKVHPFRTDLCDLIADLEVKASKSQRKGGS